MYNFIPNSLGQKFCTFISNDERQNKTDLLLKTLRDVKLSRCSSAFTVKGQRVQEDSLNLEDNGSSSLETSETTNPTTQRHIREDLSTKTIKSKVHPCTGTEALYRPYGP